MRTGTRPRIAERAADELAVPENADVPGITGREPLPRGADEGRDEVTTSSQRTDGRTSIGELVSVLSEKLSALIRDEIRLAKAEMAEKAKNAGIGIGLFAGAGVLAFWATGVLIATIILGIAEALPAWLAALIVFVGTLLVIAVLLLLGKKSLEKGTPPVPERAQASIKADVEAVREGLAKDDPAKETL